MMRAAGIEPRMQLPPSIFAQRSPGTGIQRQTILNSVFQASVDSVSIDYCVYLKSSGKDTSGYVDERVPNEH